MRNHETTEMLSTRKGNADRKQPKVIIRKKGRKDNSVVDLTDTAQTEPTGPVMEEPAAETTNEMAIITEDIERVVAVPEASDPTPPAPSALPPTPGFDLTNVSRNQGYVIRNTLMFADCCVQTSPEGVFDVLARNFDNNGGLIWWLWRIGKGSLEARVKGKDLVDAFRIAAHVLHQQLKSEIGGKLPRW